MATSRASDARAAVDRSFEQLYRGHHADVFRAALRELGNVHDAEDVTQAAFVDAYRAVLRGSRPQAPRAWLLAIAENVRRRRYRTAQRRPREEPLDADFPLSADVPQEIAHALAEALAELPDEQRRVFVLRELGGLSYEEIARETASTVGAIQMLLFRARKSLRELLEPPVVTRRRSGILVPLPGWLTSIVSRADLATTLTPRAAGAVGATVMAIAGISAATGDVAAEGHARPVPEARRAVVPSAAAPARVATAAARRHVAKAAGQAAPALASRPAAAAGRPRARPQAAAPRTDPAQQANPTLSAPPLPGAALPTASAANALPTAAATAVSAAVPTPVPAVAATAAPEVPATRVAPPPPVETVQAAAQEVQAPVQAVQGAVKEVPSTVQETLPVPVEQPRLPVPLPDEKVRGLPGTSAPPPSSAPVLEAVTGAAGAAGAGAPPPPVPGVPAVNLPPVP
jgi:RNA polymerase sigma-70 factor (ECF subfamily)